MKIQGHHSCSMGQEATEEGVLPHLFFHFMAQTLAHSSETLFSKSHFGFPSVPFTPDLGLKLLPTEVSSPALFLTFPSWLPLERESAEVGRELSARLSPNLFCSLAT